MSKVVFLKLIPQSLDVAADPLHLATALHDSMTREKSAIVIKRTADNLLNIQGYDPTPCRDKYQCWVLFQNVARGLLGISEDKAISIRFADPPCVTVNDIATILTEPRHVVSLLVSPLGLSGSDKEEVRGLLVDKRDPYCRYRERYRSRDTVRTKCNFAEMNKLLSQLSEVSLMLQRTQEECDEIARRCRRKNGAKNSTHVGAFEKNLAGSSNNGTDYTADANVEKLLHIAESLTNRIIKTDLTVAQSCSGQDAPASSVLPDCPTDVCVRPNFSGGLYVMWNPVRLDVQDENHGHRVLGYTVYVGRQPRARVEGPLASQAELHGLDYSTEYHIQVCTSAELCNSLLTPVVSYRHTHPKRDPKQLTASKTSSQSSRRRKTAKVESWLKNGQMDSTLDTTFSDSSGSPSDLAGNGLMGSPAHVHFAETTVQITAHRDIATELDGSSKEDTQSTTSSHTSGIVTDLPISPKLSPAYPCSDCIPNTTSSLMNSQSHSHSQHNTPTNAICYSPILSTFSADNTTIDTVIDEPLDMNSVSSSSLDLSGDCGETYTLATEARAGVRHKRPAAPQNIRVEPRHAGCFCISWIPVSRDSRGCSNGFFVLGYRIYVNGSSHKSVDGSMVFEALLQHPTQATAPYHKLKIHVRTRSMAGESVPSDTVTYDLQLHRTVEPRGRAKLDSALSSAASSTSLCRDSLRSQQTMGTSRYHSTSKGQKLETYV